MPTHQCARPTCHRKAIPGAHGYCRTHAYAIGVLVPRVSVEPTRRHLQHLADCGMGSTAIAKIAGVSDSHIRTILRGQTTQIRQEVARRILAVTPAASPRVPAWPAARRIRALRANGWMSKDLAAEIGVSPQTISQLSRDRGKLVEASTDRAIRSFYADHLQPVGKAMREAADWPTPQDWWDIDNPDEDPHIQMIAETTNPRLLAIAIVDHHGSIMAAGRVAGVDASTIRKLCHGKTAGTKSIHTLRQHWCDLHGIDMPQVDPMPMPEWARSALSRRVAEISASLTVHGNRRAAGIPHLAKELGVPTDTLHAWLGDKGYRITPSELDKIVTHLELPEMAA